MAEKIKVLMVDDEEQFRATTSKILSKKGYETTMAGSGEEAIEIMKKSDQDVVILDVKMPGISGQEALTEIKKINPDVQVIMLTGHGGLESAKESLTKGAFDYLNKPCDIDLLAAKINDAHAASHIGVKEEKKAIDIMISIEDYTTIDEDSTIKQGIVQLKESYEKFVVTGRIMETGHRSILVYDSQKEIVGILSIRDLIEALRPAYLSAPKPSMADSLQFSPMFWSGLFVNQAKALINKKIKDIMSDCPPSIDADANLMEIVEAMYTQNVRRLLITQKGQAVGIVRDQEIFFETARIILEP
jgi:CheY-like chemotaxis protein